MSPGQALILLCILGSAAAQYSQIATLYANNGCTGSFVVLNGFVSDLGQIGFDNRAYSARIRGTWMFYDSVNYNYAARDDAEYAYEPTESCVNLIKGGIATSVKYAGYPTDYRSDSITFYEWTYFQAAEEFVASNKATLTLDGRIQSYIITGSSSWTVYDEPNYRGNAVCIQVPRSPNYDPYLVYDTQLFTPWIAYNSIASVQKGCWSKNIVNAITNSTAQGVSPNTKISFQL